MKSFVSFIFIVFYFIATYSQCPIADFNIIDTVCAGTAVNTNNTSTNAATFFWDFSSGDLYQPPLVTDIGTIGGSFNNPTGISLVFDGSNWYGFVKNYGTSRITRLYFGSKLTNIPVATDIGNPGGLLGSSFGRFGFHKEHGNWYALTTTVSALIRLDFGNSLSSIPVATSLPTYGLLNNSRDLYLINDQDTLYALVPNLVSNNISVFMFDSLSGNMFNYYNITTVADSGFANGLYSVAAIKECDRWIAISAGFSDNNIVRLDFGSTINPKPVADKLGSLGVINFPVTIHIKFEDANYVAYIQNRSSQGLSRIIFTDSMMTTNPIAASLGTFGSLLSNTDALDIASDSSNWIAYGMNKTANSLIRVAFPDTLPSTPLIANTASPTVYYNTPGTFHITLIATDSNGNSNSHVDSIFVKESPKAGFNISNICKGEISSFTDTSTSGSNIDSWFWDFGDGDTSIAQNPTHLYSDTGIYTVTLIVSNLIGCYDTLIKKIVIAANPNAGFSAFGFCSSQPTIFTDTSSVATGTINSWIWDFGNGDSAFIKNPVYNYSSGGNNNVRLICSSNYGCFDTTSASIHINTSPSSYFNTFNTCFGDTTFFENNSSIDSGSISGFTWYFGDGDSSYFQDTSHLYPDTGDYVVSLISVSDSGCSDTVFQTINIGLKPFPGFSYNPLFICENSQILFTDTSIIPGGDTITSWIWDFGNGDSAYVKNPYYTYTTAGTYNLTLTVNAGTNCDTSITTAINVNPAPSALFSVNGLCIGDSTYFTDQSNGNIVSWNWNLGDSTISTDTNIAHLYADTGNFLINLLVTASNGCSNELNQSIRIHDLPVAGFVSSQGCSDQPVVFTDLSFSSDDTITWWTWHFGDPGSGAFDTSYLQNPTHIYSSPINYSVEQIVSTSSGCKDTITLPLNIFQSPVAQFSYDSICNGIPVNFTDNSIGTITSWKWDFNNGDTSNQKNPTYLFDSSGFHSVTLTVTDLNGCPDTTMNDVYVKSNPIAGYYVQYPCDNTTSIFIDTSSVSNSTIVNWNWEIDFNDYAVQNPICTFSDTGIYLVKLLVTSAENCSDSFASITTIHRSPVSSFSFDPLFGNPPLKVEFTNQSHYSNSYRWKIDNTDFSTDANPNFTF